MHAITVCYDSETVRYSSHPSGTPFKDLAMAIPFCLLSLCGLIMCLAACQPTPNKPLTTQILSTAPVSVTPIPRTKEFPWMSVAQWYQKHTDDIAAAQNTDVELVFVGDSITESWDWGEGRDAVYQQYFGDVKAVNFAIGGDMTQNLLWRLQHNIQGQLQPAAVVMMIGVNNFLHEKQSPDDVILGIKANLAQLQKNYPHAKILLIDVLPFYQNANSPSRQQVITVNHGIAALANDKDIFHINVNDHFLDTNGEIPKALMDDYIHPTAAGLEIIAKAVVPKIQNWIEQARKAKLTVAASDPRIQVMGRSANTDDKALIVGYPGVTFKLRSNAERITLFGKSEHGKSYFSVQVDDQPARLIQLPDKAEDIVLLEGNTERTAHTITLLNRSETWHGVSTLYNFTLYHGELLDAPALPQRKLLLIGDSITCGEAADRQANLESTCQSDNSWWGAKQSYGMQLAAMMNAQVQLVCYGGRGLVRTWDGISDGVNAPDFYDYAVPKDGQPFTWDHNQYHPDIAIVALGTNDFSASAGTPPTESHYVKTYVDFIHKIQRDHGKIPVVVTDGPLLAGKEKTQLQSYLQKIQSQSDNVHFIAANRYPGDNCNFHPHAEQHQAMANDLAPAIKKIMAW